LIAVVRVVNPYVIRSTARYIIAGLTKHRKVLIRIRRRSTRARTVIGAGVHEPEVIGHGRRPGALNIFQIQPVLRARRAGIEADRLSDRIRFGVPKRRCANRAIWIDRVPTENVIPRIGRSPKLIGQLS